jgi:macrolide-specific efflux system membrane fusion protein
MTSLRARLTRHPWITGGVVALLVVAGAGGYWLTGDDKKAAADPSYRLVAASTGTIRQSVSTTGTIEPADQESLSFSASGEVTAVSVEQGDTVKAGQVLATIDSAALRASLAQAEASLASDEAKVAADESAGTTGAQLTADESAVSAAQGQVTSARAALDGATLRSPIDGLVATVDVAVGDQVAGSSGSGSNNGSGSNSNAAASSAQSSDSSSSSGGQFLVIGTKSWIVNATVDDTQVGLIKKGYQAQITTAGATGTVYGTISSVAVVASTSSTTATYPVVVKVTGNPSGLHAGASATAALIYKQLTNVLTVPSLAVHTSGGTSVVYQMSGGKRVARTVTTGLSSGGETQIKSGLSAGDQVVVDVQTRTGTGNSGSTGGNTVQFPGGGGQFPGGEIPAGKLPVVVGN